MVTKPVTLVLGGMGVKGVASIGILQALRTHNIEVKKIYAAGASALVAGQYAMGKSPDELTDLFVDFFDSNHNALWGMEQISELFQTQRRRIVDSFGYFLRERLYCRSNLRRVSILTWDIIEPLILDVFGETTFSDLEIPLAISTIDLDEKGLFIIDSGKLSNAMKAGIAFPGLFPPVSFGERRLVSSTLCCELPLEAITKADSPVLVFDFPTILTHQQPANLLEIIARTTEIRSHAIKSRLLEKADYVITLERMNRYRWGSYRRIPQMIRHAREETARQLALIPELQNRNRSPQLAKG
ncbi:MAG TPA: patatin-like phospholipase family protein [Dehalococcoidales bacterium]